MLKKDNNFYFISINILFNKKSLFKSFGTRSRLVCFFFMPLSISNDNEIYYGYLDPSLDSLQYYKYDINEFPPTHITRYALNSDSDYNYFF